MANEAGSQAKMSTCPICKAPTEMRYRPFCSRRCADVDLARWLSGNYAIPGAGADADEDGDDSRAAEAARRMDKAFDQGT